MGRLEDKAGTFSVFGARHIWRDGIGETAGLSHDRHGAVREAVELIEPAGFVP